MIKAQLFYLSFLSLTLFLNTSFCEVKLKVDQRLQFIESQHWVLESTTASYKINKDLRDDSSLLLNQFAWNKHQFAIDLSPHYQSIVNQVSDNATLVLVNISKQSLKVSINSEALLSMDVEIANQNLNTSKKLRVQCKGSWMNPSNGIITLSDFTCNLPPIKEKKSILKVTSQTLDKSSLTPILTPILHAKHCKKIAKYYLFMCDDINATFSTTNEYTVNLTQEKSSYFSDNYRLTLDKKLIVLDHSKLKSFLKNSLQDSFFGHQRVDHEFQRELVKSTHVNLFLSVTHIDHESIDPLRKYAANLIIDQYKQALVTPILSKKTAYINYLESQSIQANPQNTNQNLTISIDLQLINGQLTYTQSFYKGTQVQNQFGFQEKKKNNPKALVIVSLILLLVILAWFSIESRNSTREK